MAAFSRLDWTCFDVWAVVAAEGVTVVDALHRNECRAWLRRHDYSVDTIDFGQGIGSAVVALGELFHWEGQFGYALESERCNLNALRDGFDFDLKPGQGHVLELLNAEVARREDLPWFCGLLSIAREYSRSQLALGARFFATVVLERQSSLIGTTYESLSVSGPFWLPGKSNPFEVSGAGRLAT